MSYRGKRALDLIIATPALIATTPLQLAVAGAVRLFMGRPVLFRQERPGLFGEPFTMAKFRTMAPPSPERGIVDDADRLTSLGRFLRSTSLDELPSLWNVVRGDMSLVGPRPLLMEYRAEYTPEQARRHRVKPGLTGLAQARGRNAQSWEERFAHDLAYVGNPSLSGDLAILALTLLRVLQRQGISAPGQATMPPFRRSEIEDSA